MGETLSRVGRSPPHSFRRNPELGNASPTRFVAIPTRLDAIPSWGGSPLLDFSQSQVGEALPYSICRNPELGRPSPTRESPPPPRPSAFPLGRRHGRLRRSRLQATQKQGRDVPCRGEPRCGHLRGGDGLPILRRPSAVPISLRSHFQSTRRPYRRWEALSYFLTGLPRPSPPPVGLPLVPRTRTSAPRGSGSSWSSRD